MSIINIAKNIIVAHKNHIAMYKLNIGKIIKMDI